MYTLGLDWISKKHGWACCKLMIREGVPTAEFYQVPVDAAADCQLVTEATKIVLDAPIGLPDDQNESCKPRPCDLGAKKWIGPAMQSTVFAPPYAAELERWRNTPADERGTTIERHGHFRGLLPAIDSADRIFQARPDATLESHPELIFTALAGRRLPRDAKKSTLIGLLLRLGLIAKWGVRIDEGQIGGWGDGGADNFVDAAAMAIVADECMREGDINVIADADGSLERLSSRGQRDHLMAINKSLTESLSSQVLKIQDVAELARVWTRET